MREIKFRAWGCDGDRGPQMWKPEYVMQYFDLWLDDESAVLMQYTGLKDVNGREIYEGDIIAQNGLVYRIEWHASKCGFYMFFKSETDTTLALGAYRGGIEIIGNVHEHPELLEGGE